MNELKEPCSETKVFHIGSNVAMIVAAVRSKLSFQWASVESTCASDAMGGPLSTFTPHPDKRSRE